MMNSELLILASKSPRRQQILREAGFNFQVKTSSVDESFPSTLPVDEVATFIAEKKALSFTEEINDKILLTADTIVCIENEILGKPSNEEEAIEMLWKLSGKKHQVITGCCLLSEQKKLSFKDFTNVFFKTLSQSEITYYIKNYKPFDKAGAYGIQEWIGMIGIEKIEGSYYNVMGLPIHKVYTNLHKYFFKNT